MTDYRNAGASSFSINGTPPSVSWTLVRGDTPAFRVFVADENSDPLVISEWDLAMDIVRPSSTNAVIVSVSLGVTANDEEGEFTVALNSNQSELLQTNDIFDIQLSDATRTWTVAKGTITVVEDVTGPYQS